VSTRWRPTFPAISPPASALRPYKEQEVVERRHRDLKQTLKVRPIFLHNDDRIYALISIIGIALLIFGLLETQLRNALRADHEQHDKRVLVGPPAVAQHPAPFAAITGPGLAVTGTSVSFQAHAVEQGSSITQYLWTFGDGGTATGPDASHVFTSAEPQTVTMTATSSFGTVTTRTLNLAVVAPSAATASTPSNTVWYSTTPVDQFVFLPTAAGALAAESWNGARWTLKVLPGRADPGSALTALNYPDASDVIRPRIFFRSADGHLAQTYRSGAVWATQTLAGGPARGSALVATTAAARASGHLAPDIPEVFYFNRRGRLTQSYEHGATWLTKTLPGPSATNLGSLALADTASDGHLATYVFYIDSQGSLTVASSTDPASPRARWQSTPIIPADNVSATSRLAAISTGPNGDQACVFSITTDGKLAAATSGPSGGAWTVSELLGTPAPQSSLLAANYLLPSGALGEEVFYLNASGQPAATSWAANTQQATTLPGTATAILGASDYPAPGQPQRLFLDKGTKITVDDGPAPGGLWTATNLPRRRRRASERRPDRYSRTPEIGQAASLSLGSTLPCSVMSIDRRIGSLWACCGYDTRSWLDSRLSWRSRHRPP